MNTIRARQLKEELEEMAKEVRSARDHASTYAQDLQLAHVDVEIQEAAISLGHWIQCENDNPERSR